MSTSAPDYFYLPLHDARKSLNMKINIMAKVFTVGKALKTRGSAYFLALKLIDQYESPPGLSMNFFADNIGKLPQVRSTGDIISVHHVEMKTNNGEIYCTYGKLSSFALFDGKSVLNLSPYQTSINYQTACNYKMLLVQLRINTKSYQPSKDLAEPLATLFCHLTAEKMLSIICKVLHVSETSDGDLLLFLWDATDSPLVTFRMDLDMEGQAQTCLHPEEYLLPRETLCAFPHLGTIIRLIGSKDFKDLSHLNGVGYWIKFCNVIFEVQSGLWKGTLTSSTYIRILSDEDDNVQCRQRIFNLRMSSKVDRLPLSAFAFPSVVTVPDYTYSLYSTLMGSLTNPEVIQEFSTVVRVVASYPWQAKDLRTRTSGKYWVRLTIEDSTARIHAYVFGEDGERFFNGYPSIDVLSKKMKRLLGIRDDSGSGTGLVPRDPPWVWCCLKSRYLDENDPWGSRRYLIYGTTLIL